MEVKTSNVWLNLHVFRKIQGNLYVYHITLYYNPKQSNGIRLPFRHIISKITHADLRLNHVHAIHINPSRGLAWDNHVIPGTESFVQPLCSSRLEILITVTHEYISRFRGASLLPSPPLWISSSLFIKNKSRSYQKLFTYWMPRGGTWNKNLLLAWLLRLPFPLWLSFATQVAPSNCSRLHRGPNNES